SEVMVMMVMAAEVDGAAGHVERVEVMAVGQAVVAGQAGQAYTADELPVHDLVRVLGPAAVTMVEVLRERLVPELRIHSQVCAETVSQSHRLVREGGIHMVQAPGVSRLMQGQVGHDPRRVLHAEPRRLLQRKGDVSGVVVAEIDVTGDAGKAGGG